ncbi:MAG: ATP-dependent DNA ligase [Motilibacteraceae bacterium]
MLLHRLALASAALASTSARSAKVRLMADALREAGAGEAGLVVTYLSGELRQRRTGLGYAALRELPPPATEPTLTLAEVDAAFAAAQDVAGAGATARRRELLVGLMARATPEEQRLLAGLVAGELRHGALEGLVTDALAQAASLPLADVRRAVMLRGALAPVAEAALADGSAGLDRFRLEVGRPVLPMLASSADGVGAALERTGPAAVEWKLDGIRVQVHRDGQDVRVFTRTLDDVTDRVPELVDAALALPVRSVVLDGEAIALAADGRPLPFQQTAGRTASRVDVGSARQATALTAFLFDVLHLDGQDLLGEPGTVRQEALVGAVPEALRVPRVVVPDPGDAAVAAVAFREALAHGHEGVLVKALDAPYEAGRRGAAWVKVKPRHTLDLVVLAAEWGHGRRTGVLSNLHLGALDDEQPSPPDQLRFAMLGKTFKGLTDAMLAWQTEALLALEERRTAHVVHVRPELVVEVAFDGVQTSPRYPAGMALRFARVLRHRPDKPAAQADTVSTVRAIHEGKHVVP